MEENKNSLSMQHTYKYYEQAFASLHTNTQKGKPATPIDFRPNFSAARKEIREPMRLYPIKHSEL